MHKETTDTPRSIAQMPQGLRYGPAPDSAKIIDITNVHNQVENLVSSREKLVCSTQYITK